MGINLGPSAAEQLEDDLYGRIRRPARDAYTIAVLGLKGGVGKTALTLTLGSTLSGIRGDRILALDADPNGGNLADRSGRQSDASVGDLLADANIKRYNDIRTYTSMNRSNLEVLSAPFYSQALRAFNGEDWLRATDVVSRYYNLMLADCGTGLFDDATRGVLSTASAIVIVASASLDGARQAAVAIDWLRQNGYHDLLSRLCIVINYVVPGRPSVDVKQLVAHFQSFVAPGHIVVLPWDKHLAAGGEIDLHAVSSTYRRRVVDLAAALSDDFGGRGRN